jgi:Flp pilus assembly protein TadG
MTVSSRPAAFLSDETGQSMVELALMLPLLLLIVIGIIDVGRIFSYAIAATSAAREAALAAARDPQATADAICERAREELDAGAAADPCATPEITVDCVRDGVSCGNASGVVLAQTSAGAAVTVTVRYRVQLLSGYLVGRAFNVNPVTVTGRVAFAGLSE